MSLQGSKDYVADYDPSEKFGVRGFKFPINKKLASRAKEMAKNMTSAECKFWFDILKYNEYKWLKQKIIDNYIVDFYCHKLGLVVEIDGPTHSDRQEYDAARSEFLECFGLQVLRYSNEAVLQNTFGVKADLNERIVERIENLKTKPCSENI